MKVRTMQRMTRRHLLQVAIVGSGLAAGSSLLAACGPSAPQATQATPGVSAPSSGATPAAAAAGTPVKGGTLTVGIYQEPPTLDPHVSGSATAGRVMAHIFDSLVRQPDPGNFQPGLATAWDSSDGGTTWTVKLRSGVTFHDGTPFNAAAVKFSFDRIVDPKTKSLSAIGLLGPYNSTEVVDDSTVKVTFKTPFVAFPDSLSSVDLSPVSPAAVAKFGDNFGQNPVGTGPFQFKEWTAGSEVTVQRYDAYNWAPSILGRNGPAYLDAVQFKFLLEDATRTGALQKGEVLMIDQTPDHDVAQLKQDPNFRIDTIDQPGSPQVLPLNCSRAPTDDISVRKALLYSLDRQAMINAVFGGQRPVAYGPLAPNTWSYLKDVEQMYAYSPQQAQQLLDQAGWTMNSSTGVREKNGQPLSVHYITTDDSGNKLPAEFAQQAWKQVGFDVNLEAMAYAATAPMMLRGEHNIARIGYSATDPEFLYTLYHSDNIAGTNFNRTMTKFPELDSNIEKMNSESDPNQRLALSQTIQRFIMDNALIVPLYVVVFIYSVSTKVQDVKYDLGASPYYYNIWLKP